MGTGSAVGGVEVGRGRGVKAAEQGGGTGEKAQTRVKAKVSIAGPTKTIGGTLDGNAISSVLKRKTSAFQKCHERELKKNPKAGGKIIIMFTIASSGRVSSSKATADSVGGGVGQCVAGVIQRLRFPKPSGGDVTVNKSFVFSPSN